MTKRTSFTVKSVSASPDQPNRLRVTFNEDESKGLPFYFPSAWLHRQYFMIIGYKMTGKQALTFVGSQIEFGTMSIKAKGTTPEGASTPLKSDALDLEQASLIVSESSCDKLGSLTDDSSPVISVYAEPQAAAPVAKTDLKAKVPTFEG